MIAQARDRRETDRTARIATMRARSIEDAKAALRGTPSGPVWWGALPLARELLREADAQSAAWAADLIRRVLGAQVVAPRHPHRGNFV